MNNSTILLIGNCVLDQIWELDHFPHEDEELRAQFKTSVAGGNACNTAQILARLDNDVELASSLADDSTASWLLQELSVLGISTQFCVQKSGYSSAQSSIWLNRQNGSRSIVHFRNLPELSLQELNGIPLQHRQWIHFEGRNVDVLNAFLSGHDGFSCPLSLEIEKDRPGIESLLPFIDVAIVSSAYLKNKNISAEQCLKTLTQFNPDLEIVCTLGSSGLVAKNRAGKIFHIAAEKVDNVVDTVGAGDCFIGGLIDQLNRQQDFESALTFANKLAAQKIQYKGMHFHD